MLAPHFRRVKDFCNNRYSRCLFSHKWWLWLANLVSHIWRQIYSLDKREICRTNSRCWLGRTHFTIRKAFDTSHTRICKFVRINLDAHIFAWIHTQAQTLWRIYKQTPGTDKCSLNKQTFLCLSLPTHPLSFPTAATNPCTTVHTVEYINS